MRRGILTGLVFTALIGLLGGSMMDWQLPWKKKHVDPTDWCAAHEVALSQCEKCNPELARGGTVVSRDREPNEGECPNTLVRVKLGPGVAAQVGLETYVAEAREVAETIQANAETQYTPSRYARVAPRVTGIIREVRATLGEDVAEGAALAVIESGQLAEAKSEYLQAAALLKLRTQTYEQEKTLHDKRITPGRELLQSQAALEESKLGLRRAVDRLTAYGLSRDEVDAIAQNQDASALVTIVAPFAGTVVALSAVPGEAVAPDKPVFSVAALERMWLAIDAYEGDLGRIEKDQRVIFTVEALRGQRFVGKVVAIGNEVDDQTRIVRVFSDIKNAQRQLRANMFGRAEIAVKPAAAKLLIPKAALQNDGDCWIVFVASSNNTFQTRKVEVGTTFEAGYEIVGGLAPGERVVTTGSFLLKTEVLRGQIGAG